MAVEHRPGHGGAEGRGTWHITADGRDVCDAAMVNGAVERGLWTAQVNRAGVSSINVVLSPEYGDSTSRLQIRPCRSDWLPRFWVDRESCKKYGNAATGCAEGDRRLLLTRRCNPRYQTTAEGKAACQRGRLREAFRWASSV